MKNKFIPVITLLVLLAIMGSSCGTTTYRKRAYTSKKYIGYKAHMHWWHAHHYRPHPHNGGYW